LHSDPDSQAFGESRRRNVHLSNAQREVYFDAGYLLLPQLFSSEQVEEICDNVEHDARFSGPHNVPESGSTEGGTVYAPHERSELLRYLVRSPQLLGPVQELLNSDVYIYQMKVNVKSPLGDNKVAWHQDYTAWATADDLPRPDLVNVAIYLDDSTEFNGSLMFVSGSHHGGVLGRHRNGGNSQTHLDPSDIALRAGDLSELVTQERNMASTHGTRGTAVLFHPLIVHGSHPNMSPVARRLLIITYNAVHNLPRTSHPRPTYLVGRNTVPLSNNDVPTLRGASK